MRHGISLRFRPATVSGLQAIVAAPGSSQKHVWRARIVLLSAEGLGTSAIMAETDKFNTYFWRW